MSVLQKKIIRHIVGLTLLDSTLQPYLRNPDGSKLSMTQRKALEDTITDRVTNLVEHAAAEALRRWLGP